MTFETIFTTIYEHRSDIWAFIGALPAAAGIWTAFHLSNRQNARSDLEKKLDDPRSHPALIAKLTRTNTAAYDDALQSLMIKTAIIFGTPKEYRRAFSRCLSFNFIYPVAILTLGWLFFDVGTIAGSTFFPENLSTWRRCLAVMLLASLFILTLNSPKLQNLLFTFFKNKFTKPIHRSVFFEGAIKLSSSMLSIMVIFTLVCALVLGTGSGIVAVVIAIAGFGIIFPTLLLIAAASVAFSSLSLQSGFYGGTIVETKIASTFYIFLLVLPIYNSCADFASLTVSRFFLGRLRERSKKQRLTWTTAAWDVFLDLFFALFCLSVLAWLTIATFEFQHQRVPDNLIFDWRLYLERLSGEDYSQIHMILMLCLTTIIPTLVHFGYGAVAIATQQTREYAVAADRLRAGSLHTGELQDIRDIILRGEKRGAFKGVMITVAIACVLGLGLWHGFFFVLGLL